MSGHSRARRLADQSGVSVTLPVAGLITAAVSAPLFVAVLNLTDPSPDVLMGSAMLGSALLAVLAWFVIAAIRRLTSGRALAYAEAERVRAEDPRTGLLVRSSFVEQADSELRRIGASGEGAALLIVDIDRFRHVNELGGEKAGDALLADIGARLRRRVRRTDIAARISADRFALLQIDLSTPGDAETLAGRLLGDLRSRRRVGDREVDISVSIGIAVVPGDGTGAEDLIRRAELAVTAAQSAGRDRYSFFAPELEQAAQRRRAVEIVLRQAAAGAGMGVVFQPKMQPDGRTVAGVEALMRWPQDVPDPLTPDVFIPVAEEIGLIETLSERMWRDAIRIVAPWPGLSLALNLSPVQFLSGRLVESVRRLIAETGIDPRRLEFEITEGVLVRDSTEAVEALCRLRELGVRIALDDFGTGYSGLSYLRDFPLDTIKIDQSFVRGIDTRPDTAAIVQGVVLIARTLGLTVVAEGVDSPAEHRFLQASGCHILQGFLFSRPLTAAALTDFLADRPISAKAA
jgi:diguanylate cyclase (GGDEF)-like protein